MKFGISNIFPCKAALHMFVNIIIACVFLCSSGYGQQNQEQNNELFEAAKTGNVVLLKKLIDAKADLNAKDSEGATPLMQVVAHGHAEAVKLLVEAKADVNTKGPEGITALMVAAHEGQTEAVKLLILGGADVNAKTTEGLTALMAAATKGQAEAVKQLILGGADVNAKIKIPEVGMLNALDMAATNGNVEATRALLVAGATLNNNINIQKLPEQIRVLIENSGNKVEYRNTGNNVVAGMNRGAYNAESIKRVSVEELQEALDNNAAAAKDTYYGKNVEIKGKLGTIDSDLDYIVLEPMANVQDKIMDNFAKALDFDAEMENLDAVMQNLNAAMQNYDADLRKSIQGGIHCNIKNSETKEVVKTLKRGQIIVVKGKITRVGDFLGYWLDIVEIHKQ